MAGRLQIGVLGELRVTSDGRELPLPPSKKTRALLAYLAVAGRPQRRERLCELFWEVPDDPRGALRWSISKIRQIVNDGGEDRLKADRNTVCLEVDSIDLDFGRVAQLKPQDVEAFNGPTLEALAGAFRGRFLDDLSLPYCPEFEAWRVSHADKLDVLRLRILRALVDGLREEPERALVHLHALQNLDPEDATVAREVEMLVAAARQGATVQSTVRSDRPASEAPTPAERRDGPDHVAHTPDTTATSKPQEVRFCTTRDRVQIAYGLSGAGPPVVRAAHWMSHLQFDWQSPVWQHWIDGLSERNTLVRYDERGNGLSDWEVADLSFEAMVADLESVVDASGLTRFTLLGVSQSCAVSVAYAVRHPERVSGLVLYGGYVKGWRKRGSPHEIASREAFATLMREGWGQDNPAFRQLFASSYIPEADPDQIAWFDELQRRTVSPENAWRLQNSFGDIDVSPLLSEVVVPTLVLHARRDAAVPFESGRALATGIPGARFVELDSANHILVRNEPAFLRFLTEVRAFVSANEARRDRALTSDQTRKRISVLAAEIISPLLAFEEADPEIAMEAIDPLLNLAVEVVGRHDGTVVSRGQADLTAIFGAPAPAEDHARQACRAALAMKSAVEQAAEGASRIRASLDTGEAIVRVRALAQGSRVEVNGAPVRVARQLTQALRRDIVAATDRTCEAAGGSFRMEPLARSDHPSFARDVRAYAVLAEDQSFSRRPDATRP